VLAELKQSGGRSGSQTKFALAVAAFNRISNYDAAISDYLSSLQPDGTRSEFPGQSNGRFVKLQDLRYGENPHQSAAFYRDLYPRPARWSRRSSFRARSSRTTTSPTPTRPGNA
jgi:phosphoribosylaminoimidazolecarboxamide formyltransferase/IMP cyclohydrolase